MKKYAVTMNFWKEYFKDFLDSKKLKYTTSWKEGEDDFLTVSVETLYDTDVERDIHNFLKFPVKVKKVR